MKERLLEGGFEMQFSMDYSMIIVSEKVYHHSNIPVMQIELQTLHKIGEYVVSWLCPEPSKITL